jgi:membrane-associated phospholipid phosphatase
MPVRRLVRHLRSLWPGWTLIAPLPFVVHPVWAAARGDVHWENAAVLATALALFGIGPRTKKLFLGVYPIGLVGILYDSMRVVQNVGVSPASVHLCDLRAHELALFGVTMNGERVTLHDWFQTHWSPWLDRLCAIPYGTFIFVCIAAAGWMYVRSYPRMVRFAWCFFALNVAGFVTYHLYPAAPPWYFHAHGCVVDVHAHASEGPNLARVDAWLGIPYFAGMYGRASDVFGAMPSLHCAYALLVALEGWAVFSKAWRVASVAFFALMCFSAVYLDHHWIVDALAGITYCVVVVGAARVATRWRASRVAARSARTSAVAVDVPLRESS